MAHGRCCLGVSTVVAERVWSRVGWLGFSELEWFVVLTGVMRPQGRGRGWVSKRVAEVEWRNWALEMRSQTTRRAQDGAVVSRMLKSLGVGGLGWRAGRPPPHQAAGSPSPHPSH